MKTPFKIIIFIIVILGILYFFFPRLLPSLFIDTSSSLWRINKEIRKENSNINTELDNLTISELQKENIELKSLLGRTASTSRNMVLAYVLKKPPFSSYDLFIIDVGSINGIKVGDKAYAFGDILIGEVAEVFNDVSKVRLYSSQGEKYEVNIGQDNIQTSATGKGGGAFEVILPRDVTVHKGDVVTVPDISNSVFGIVKDILVEPAKAFSTILFSQPLNIYQQKWIVIDHNEE